MTPEIEYPIKNLERVGKRVFVHFDDPTRRYLLSKRYAAKVSSRDI